MSETQGNVGLSDAGSADQQQIGFLLDETQRREFLDHVPVEPGLRVEVEVLETLLDRKVSEAKPTGQPTHLGRGDLFGEQPLQEHGCRDALALRLVEVRRDHLRGANQTEVGQMRAQALVDGVGAHRMPFDSRS